MYGLHVRDVDYSNEKTYVTVCHEGQEVKLITYQTSEFTRYPYDRSLTGVRPIFLKQLVSTKLLLRECSNAIREMVVEVLQRVFRV